MSIRILVVDDHGIIRQGLHTLLEGQADIEVVAEAKDGREAIELVAELTPDIVIMDITMPNLNGVDAARRIISEYPKTRIIALSIHSNKRFIADMLRAGASGYILKECLFDELIQAIHTVANGGIHLSTEVANVALRDYKKHLLNADESRLDMLTDRECEVLQLIAEGKSMKQIALELHVSTKTIEANRRQIMKKLDIHSVAELTKYAVREGLTPL